MNIYRTFDGSQKWQTFPDEKYCRQKMISKKTKALVNNMVAILSTYMVLNLSPQVQEPYSERVLCWEKRKGSCGLFSLHSAKLAKGAAGLDNWLDRGYLNLLIAPCLPECTCSHACSTEAKVRSHLQEIATKKPPLWTEEATLAIDWQQCQEPANYNGDVAAARGPACGQPYRHCWCEIVPEGHWKGIALGLKSIIIVTVGAPTRTRHWQSLGHAGVGLVPVVMGTLTSQGPGAGGGLVTWTVLQEEFPSLGCSGNVLGMLGLGLFLAYVWFNGVLGGIGVWGDWDHANSSR